MTLDSLRLTGQTLSTYSGLVRGFVRIDRPDMDIPVRLGAQ
jgi:hypothetical protein